MQISFPICLLVLFLINFSLHELKFMIQLNFFFQIINFLDFFFYLMIFLKDSILKLFNYF